MIDTNILVYANNEDSPFHPKSKEILEKALNGELSTAFSIQNLLEFYAIITDKKRVEHPLTPKEANNLLDFYKDNEHIMIIYPLSTTINTIIQILKQYPPKGQHIFDLLLVATMKDNDITQIYTSNTKHFTQFDFIKVINPL